MERRPATERRWRAARSRLIILLVLAASLAAAGLTLSAAVLERRADPYGLIETVYATENFQGPPLLQGQDGSFGLSFSEVSGVTLKEHFSVRWEGFWDVGVDGAVDVFASADDRVKVFVDDVLVLEHEYGQRTAGQALRLSGGAHRLKVEYVQHNGSARLRLLWAPPGGSPLPFFRESLFAREPDQTVLSTARRAGRLQRAAATSWSIVAFLYAVVGGVYGLREWRRRGLRLGPMVQRLVERYGAWTDQHSPAGRIVFLTSVTAIVLSACLTRRSALNPESLWYDDVAWAALIRTDTISAMLRVPTHAPPGFLILLRVFRDMFTDPEWSVQLPSFICGIAAIPVMALAVRRLTKSPGLAILAAALTALNPLLAHYTVYVKQYSLDFLVTATLLLIAATLLDGRDIRARSVVLLTLFSGLVLLFSFSSVFVSPPIVAVVTWLAVSRKRSTPAVVLSAAIFVLILSAAFLLFRSRIVELAPAAIRGAFFGHSFAPRQIWAFLSTIGRRVVETSLPTWRETQPWAPGDVSWAFPLVGVGLIWLLARKESRLVGWTLLGFVFLFTFATYAQLYPLSNDRRGIFTFPVFICLAVAAFQMATAWLPWREVLRLAAGLGVAALAIYAPIQVQYWGVNDAQLIERMVQAPAVDGVILSPAGTYLAGYYGRWPIAVNPGEAVPGQIIGLVRDRTVVGKGENIVERFLQGSNIGRVWYVAYRTPDRDEDDVLRALSDRGYAVERVAQTTRGTLFYGVLH